MDSQAIDRLTVFAAIVALVALGTFGGAQRELLLAIGIPAAFIAGGFFLLSLPYVATRVGEGKSVPLKKLLDIYQHAGVLAWFDLFILWCVSFIAFLGFAGGTLVYRILFIVLVLIGFAAALRDLYLSEEPDVQQAEWQEHPDAKN